MHVLIARTPLWYECVLVSSGCHCVTKRHKLGLEQQQFIVSRFWELEVQDQGGGLSAVRPPVCPNIGNTILNLVLMVLQTLFYSVGRYMSMGVCKPKEGYFVQISLLLYFTFKS